LVDDLLDVSRITRGKVELRRERLELATIIHSAVAICTPMIEAAQCELRLDLLQEPLAVVADPVRLTQIISNLLNNATKYTPANGIITVSLALEQKNAVIAVKDNGEGIDSESLPRIFDLFVQVENPTTRAHGGLGIGLTLVRNLVQLHGGTIEAKSEGLGKGSEFIIRLPLDDAPLQITGVPLARDLKAQAISPPAATSVLVVDDDRDSGNSLALLLRLQGHDVRVAFDGAAALQAIEAMQPNVALIDIGMPVMDGYELARRLRQGKFDNITLVALTGWGQDRDRNLSAKAGFDYHLVKPASRESLNALFSKLQTEQSRTTYSPPPPDGG
jgi:CheY-like chemotaxis protein/two-component sensor histidine kinase